LVGSFLDVTHCTVLKIEGTREIRESYELAKHYQTKLLVC